MRVDSLTASRLAVGEHARSESLAPPADAEAAGPRPARESAAPLQRGLRSWEPALNRRLAAAQQALGFLDQLAARLEAVKADLSARLAAQTDAADPKLENQLRELAELWRARREASGGTLDGQLTYGEPARTQQRFRIRGLDFATLQSGERERLFFSVGTAGQRLSSVLIEPGLSAEAIVQRFNQALAPAGIHVAQDGHEGLVFSVPESLWPDVRDTLAVRGGGQRFPSGQLTRVKIDAEPDALRPDTWQLENVAAMRRVLHEIILALERVKRVREEIIRALAETRAQIERLAAQDERDWAMSFVRDFEAMTWQPRFPVFSAIAPALNSISRARVLSLLSLR